MLACFGAYNLDCCGHFLGNHESGQHFDDDFEVLPKLDEGAPWHALASSLPLLDKYELKHFGKTAALLCADELEATDKDGSTLLTHCAAHRDHQASACILNLLPRHRRYEISHHQNKNKQSAWSLAIAKPDQLMELFVTLVPEDDLSVDLSTKRRDTAHF